MTIEDYRAYALASKFHPNLEKYRGIYTNKSIVIIGGGSSLKHYKPLKDCIHIGVNRAYMLDNIHFDYLFAQDKFPREEEIEGFINYKPEECIKFLGLQTITRDYRIRPSTIARIKNKEIYVLNNRRPKDTFVPIDITAEPFAFYAGTVFGALQFALLTNAKNIYLVGFDCNISHAFEQNKNAWDLTIQLKYWKQFKEYKYSFFEHNNIISINPVNLKGMFEDIYTQSFINENPELQKENIEIL